MVLTLGLTGTTTPALVIPDEQTWTLSGINLAGEGVHPVFEPGAARRLLVPEHLPEPLTGPLAALLGELPAGIEPERQRFDPPGTVSLPRSPAAGADHAEDRGDSSEHGAAETVGGHGGHDAHAGHGDMMAIVGEPSADGLVMESIALRYGPLATPLPGGLAVDVTLDGDVVAESRVDALLSVHPATSGVPAPPDQFSPIAWTVAIGGAADDARTPGAGRWTALAAVELERAISHLAWLRSFGRILGWHPLVDKSSTALSGLHAARTVIPWGASVSAVTPAAVEAVEAALSPVAEVAELAGSRWLRLRTGGRGALGVEKASQMGLTGPAARASGLAQDARADDPLYRELGFEPVIGADGDSLARALVRMKEAVAATALASQALRFSSEGRTAPSASRGRPGASVEGPRGPLHARLTEAGWELTAPGGAAARDAAAAAMVGCEWATALVALASFDLSPWVVEG